MNWTEKHEINLHYSINIRAIQNVTSSELLMKQAMWTKNVIVLKNTYILTLQLNIVTAIEALDIDGNKFLYDCFCSLWA